MHAQLSSRARSISMTLLTTPRPPAHIPADFFISAHRGFSCPLTGFSARSAIQDLRGKCPAAYESLFALNSEDWKLDSKVCTSRISSLSEYPRLSCARPGFNSPTGRSSLFNVLFFLFCNILSSFRFCLWQRVVKECVEWRRWSMW